MVKMGIPPAFSQRIAQLYKNRYVYMKTTEGLIGPRIMNVGLPQGSILSPLLYLVYTSDIDSYFDDADVLQFADDICIYVHNCALEEGFEKLERTIYSLKDWLFGLGLQLSEAKSKICVFTRKRITIPAEVTLANIKLQIVDEVTTLGITLDKKLLWRKHIERIIGKSEKAINILRATCYTKWGGGYC